MDAAWLRPQATISMSSTALCWSPLVLSGSSHPPKFGICRPSHSILGFFAGLEWHLGSIHMLQPVLHLQQHSILLHSDVLAPSETLTVKRPKQKKANSTALVPPGIELCNCSALGNRYHNTQILQLFSPRKQIPQHTDTATLVL